MLCEHFLIPKFSRSTRMRVNWFPSMEELAADPSYTEAPAVAVQVADFGKPPDNVTEDLVQNGFVVRQVYNAEDLTNTVNNGVFTKGEDQKSHEGQVLTAVTKWPDAVTIPDGGHVLAMDMPPEELKLIQDEGYQLHTSVESFVASIRSR